MTLTLEPHPISLQQKQSTVLERSNSDFTKTEDARKRDYHSSKSSSDRNRFIS